MGRERDRRRKREGMTERERQGEEIKGDKDIPLWQICK